METVFMIAVLQAALGAFDTLYYHEYRCRLPREKAAVNELRLHAARDFAYSLLFAVLGLFEPGGLYAFFLLAVLGFEIVITMIDFVEEDRIRKLYAGERIMHGLMAIVYGAFMVKFLPVVWAWAGQPTALHTVDRGVWSVLFGLAALGVAGSGIRDLLAARTLSRS